MNYNERLMESIKILDKHGVAALPTSLFSEDGSVKMYEEDEYGTLKCHVEEVDKNIENMTGSDLYHKRVVSGVSAEEIAKHLGIPLTLLESFENEKAKLPNELLKEAVLYLENF